MGQVFWKFLVAFWAALILAGTLVWTVNEVSRAADDEPRPVWIGPQLRLVLGSAQLMVDSGGIQLLGDVLQRWEDDPMSRDKILLLNDKEDALHLRHVLQNPVQGSLDDILLGLHPAPAVGPCVLDRLVDADRQGKRLFLFFRFRGFVFSVAGHPQRQRF